MRIAWLLLLLPAFGGCADALERSPAVPDHALSVAGELHRVVEDGEGQVLGSATALGPSLLLTNRHVVERRELLRARVPGGLAPVKKVLIAEGLDAALLRLGPHAANVAPPAIAGAAASHGTIAVAGMAGHVRRLEQGWTEAHGQPETACAQYAFAQAPVAPGFSGGPMVTSDGRLIGIVAAAVFGSEAAAQLMLSTEQTSGRVLTSRRFIYVPICAVLMDSVIGSTAASELEGPARRVSAPPRRMHR